MMLIFKQYSGYLDVSEFTCEFPNGPKVNFHHKRPNNPMPIRDPTNSRSIDSSNGRNKESFQHGQGLTEVEEEAGDLGLGHGAPLGEVSACKERGLIVPAEDEYACSIDCM